MEIENEQTIEVCRVSAEIAANDLDHAEWSNARAIRITRYWSGAQAPVERHAEARLIWSDEALCVRFNCRQAEPLIISAAPQLERKTIGLWDRDVCEIFVAPDTSAPERYIELEAAPTGEWLDLAIQRTPDGRETDWEFHSGMSVAARIAADHITIAMRVPWNAFARTPRIGERWRANLFRCVGTGPQRGYLAWQPTRTEQPNFHVPEAFGWLAFKG